MIGVEFKIVLPLIVFIL